MPARRFVTLCAASLVALTLVPGPSAAARMPEVVADVGGTRGIAELGSAQVVQGNPNGGGVSLALSLLWPIEDHLRVGVMGIADDLGDQLGRLVDTSGVDLGPVSALHRTARGVVCRMDVSVPSHGFLTPCFGATVGFYRMVDDVRGVTFRRVTVAGLGLGAGVLRRINDRHAAGAVVRVQQLGHGSTFRYLSAALEWRWGPGAAE